MNQEDFLKFLLEKGFPNPVLVTQPPNGRLAIHTHPFEVIALVVEGSISIRVKDIELTYVAGDIFHLSFAEPHSENYGANGVSYLASRKVQSVNN